MARFSKGTTDHDGDGRMGGSRKGTVMAKEPKKSAPKKAAKKVEEQFEEADAKGAPEAPTEEEIQVGLQVRGY